MAKKSVQASQRRVPLAVWFVLVAVTGYLLVDAYSAYAATRTTLRAISPGGSAPELLLTFFPDQLAFTTPSPPPPLGTATLPAGGSLTVGPELVPQQALVRYAGNGVGTGFVFVSHGKETTLTTEAPGSLWGRVVTQRPYLWFGWRTGTVPVAAAEVTVMGGGEHGIPLASARCDAEGVFELDGIAMSLAPLSLRIRAPGFALLHEPIVRGPVAAEGQTITLVQARNREGKVLAPPECLNCDLRVLARGLPGVDAVVARDGAFSLQGVPAELEPDLLLVDLPRQWAQPRAIAWRDRAAVVEVVAAGSIEGIATSATDGAPLPGCYVWFGEGAAVQADAQGRFVLEQVVPGSATLTARHVYQPRHRMPIVRVGQLQLTVAAGAPTLGVVVTVP